MMFKSEIEDFNGLHDVIAELRDKGDKRPMLSEEQLLEVFMSLPFHIQMIAHEWTCSDTVFRDEAFVYLRDSGKKL